MVNLDEFRDAVRKRLDEIDEEFNGLYGEDLKRLSGLSEAEIDEITPGDTTDIETYRKLMAVVEEASRRNVEVAALRERVLALGAVAIEIVKKVPPMAARLGF